MEVVKIRKVVRRMKTRRKHRKMKCSLYVLLLKPSKRNLLILLRTLTTQSSIYFHSFVHCTVNLKV